MDRSKSGSRAPASYPELPGADAMLKAWSSWMDAAVSSTRQLSEGSGSRPALSWQTMPDEMAGQALAAGVQQLNQALAKDPLLHSIDQLWNANPLRDVVPVD